MSAFPQEERERETCPIAKHVAVVVIGGNQPHAIIVKRLLDVGALVLLRTPVGRRHMEPAGLSVE